MALVFDRSLDVNYAMVDNIVGGLRRIVADNPGPYTFKGTATFVIGRGDVAVVDPGPADQKHIDAILAALEQHGERVSHILVTHTHPDHSPGAALLKERTGAPTYGFGPHPVDEADDNERGAVVADTPNQTEADAKSEEKGDRNFRPDIVVGHGGRIAGTGWAVEAVHTPGHLANHLCFALPAERVLFTGDHVMGWSTSVISPPGGDLDDYLASLRLLLDRPDRVYVPTHGSPIEGPHEFVRALIAHRHERTRQITEQLRIGQRTIPAIVAALYEGLDERLVKAAGRSVLAHLISLERRGDVVAGVRSESGDPEQTYQLAGTGRS